MITTKRYLVFLALISLTFLNVELVLAQEHGDHATHQDVGHSDHEEHGDLCGHTDHHGGEFDPAATAFHHIADPNVFSIGPFNFALPCILYAKEEGLDIFYV